MEYSNIPKSATEHVIKYHVWNDIRLMKQLIVHCCKCVHIEKETPWEQLFSGLHLC